MMASSPQNTTEPDPFLTPEADTGYVEQSVSNERDAEQNEESDEAAERREESDIQPRNVYEADAPLQSMETSGGLASGNPSEIVKNSVEEVSPSKVSKLVHVLVESTCTGVSQPPVTPHNDLEGREFEAKVDALTIEERLTSKEMIIDQLRERIVQLYEEMEKLVINVRKLEERLRKAEQTSEKDIVKKELERKMERCTELEKIIAEVREEKDELKEENYQLRREKKKREKMSTVVEVDKILCRGDVPRRPGIYFERRELVEKIRKELHRLKDCNGCVVIHGLANIGKTVIAAEAIRDVTLQEVFTGGVFWFTVGQMRDAGGKIDNTLLLSTVNKLIRLLDKSCQLPTYFREATVCLQQVMTTQHPHALLVLDDICSPEVLQAFGVQCRMMVTSRNKAIADSMKMPHTYPVSISQFSMDEGKRFLVQCLDTHSNSLSYHAGTILDDGWNPYVEQAFGIRHSMMSSVSVCEKERQLLHVSSDMLSPHADTILHCCRGMPLAIALVGMKLKMDPCEAKWKAVAKKLEQVVGCDDFPTIEEPDQGKGADDSRIMVDLGKRLGGGSYGEVFEARYKGKSYAVKKFHYTCTSSATGIHKERKILTRLEHENIVQCCGICYTKCCDDPLLLMEMLKCDLQHYISDDRSEKLSPSHLVRILIDVASGLAYLHDEPIIHRDLTARNVLLTFSPTLTAKVSDFGNSKIVESGSARDKTKSTYPGNKLYMPPEARHGHYTMKLDIFSFGHLALCTMVEHFPTEILPRISLKGELRSELQRRQKYISQLNNSVADSDQMVPTVIELIKKCLKNDDRCRPEAVEIRDKLSQQLQSTTEHDRLVVAEESSDLPPGALC